MLFSIDKDAGQPFCLPGEVCIIADVLVSM